MKKTGLHPEDIQLLPDGKGWLMAEFGGDSKEDSDAKARAVMAALKSKPDAPTMKLFDDMEEESKVWEVRESGLGATAFVPGMQRHLAGLGGFGRAAGQGRRLSARSAQTLP